MADKKLRKNVLEKVPVVYATKATVSLAKRNYDTKFYIHAETKIIDHQRMLVIHAYKRSALVEGNVNPQFRVFITQTDYISQYYQDHEVKWRTARLEVLLDYCSYGKGTMCCNNRSVRSIRSFLGVVDRPSVELIKQHQKKIMGKRLAKKHKHLIKSIDQKMREIRPLHKDFEQWVHKEGMTESRYIFYRYSRRKYMDGYCTHCEQDVKVQGVRHRSVGVCPHCGTKVTFLVEGKAKHIVDWDQVAYFQKTKGGFVVRYFNVYKKYNRDYRNPELFLFELQRDFYEGDKVHYYEWREFKQSGKVRWCDDCMKYRFERLMIYPKNLSRAIKGTSYQYCALKEYLRGSIRKRINPFYYLKEYRRHPFLEYLVKAGMYQLAYELTHNSYCSMPIDKTGKTLPQILRVKKQEIPLIQDLDMSMKQLKTYQGLCALDIHLEPHAFLRFCERYDTSMDTIFTLLKHTTLHKIEKYGQRFVDEKHGYLNILKQWKDYLGFCDELGYDLKNSFVLFPKDLMAAHDMASLELFRKKEAKKKEQLQAEEHMWQKLFCTYQGKYQWTDGKYMVVVPNDLFSIKEEGHILRHCVGNYISKILDEESIILFIRSLDQPEKSFYTMEIKGNQINQCHGYRNKDMTEEVERFVEKYKKAVLQPIWLKKAV